jgi:hypothetical protein
MPRWTRLFGKDKRGDEMREWAGDKQKRLAKIQQVLEADARLVAEEERRIEAEKEQQRQGEGRKKPGKPAAPPLAGAQSQGATQLYRRGKPHDEVEGRLRSGL